MTYCQLRHDFHNTSTYNVVVILDKYTENEKKKNKNTTKQCEKIFFNNRN